MIHIALRDISTINPHPPPADRSDMRGAFLMCLLAVSAALSLHYLNAANAARAPGTERSDPVTSVDKAYPVSFDDPDVDSFASVDAQDD